MNDLTDVVTLLTTEYTKLNGELTELTTKQKIDRKTLQDEVQIRRRALKALGAAIPKAPKKVKAGKQLELVAGM
jgi:hypothetical protein